MGVVTSLSKAALLAAAVALYWKPLAIAARAGVAPPEGGFQPAHVNGVRFALSAVAYSYALSCASRWFVAIIVLIALQTVCMSAAIADKSLLGGVLGGALDATQEKQLFESGAVMLFGLLLVVILFGGRTNGKDYYRRRLVAFYAKYNPDKISDVGKILKKYEGKEELLFARLHRKYSRVLSHTPAEDAVDDLDREGTDDDDLVPEGAYIEEVEYIQPTASPSSSSSSSYSKTVFSSKLTTTVTSSNGHEEVKEEYEEEVDEANLPMIQPRVKSPVVQSPATKSLLDKTPSVPPSPAPAASVSAVGSAAGSAVGSRTSSPPRSPGSEPSSAVRKASEEARRALQERVQQRVAQLQSRSVTKKH